MRYILCIAKLQHQLVTSLCILRKGEAFFPRAGREAIVGQGQRNKMEGGRVVVIGVCELLVDLQRFHEAAGPTMDEQ